MTTGEARDATFLLTGAGTWVGKLAYLTADTMKVQAGKGVIAQAISDYQVKDRGLGHPCVNLPAQQLFQFDPPRSSLQKMHLEIAVLTTHHHPMGPPEAKNVIGIGETRGPQSSWFPSPSPDCWFESDRSSLSTASSMSSRSDQSDESRHSR